MAENKREKRDIDDLLWKQPENIRCEDCVFRAKDVGKMKGAAFARCECYPKNDKPIDIITEGKDCIYYCGEDF